MIWQRLIRRAEPSVVKTRVTAGKLVRCDCGHWDNDPRKHDESGRERKETLCRNCHELILSRDMRLDLQTKVHELSE